MRATLAVIVCLGAGCTEPDDSGVSLTVTISDHPDGTSCDVNVRRWVVFTPDPSSVPVDEGFVFTNAAAASYTIVSLDTAGDDGTPLLTVAPGESSTPLAFQQPATIRYAAQGCHGQFDGSGTLNVTVALTE